MLDIYYRLGYNITNVAKGATGGEMKKPHRWQGNLNKESQMNWKIIILILILMLLPNVAY